MPKVVIGLAGRAGSGKSAVANLLVKELGAVKSSFADPLKNMLKVLGLSDAQLWGDLKEVPDYEILHGRTPRWAMQKLGTEYGRHLIHPDLWASAWKRVTLLHRPTVTVIEDVRFGNECDAIKSLGGIVIGLERERPSPLILAKEKLGLVHASENFTQLVAKNSISVVSNRGSLESTMTNVLLEASTQVAKLPKGT